MRKLLLTTAFALPLGLGAAFAQDTAPAADPMAEPAETAPMDAAPATDPMADPMADPATGDMATDDMATGDAEEAAAAASAAGKVEVEQAANEWRTDWITGATVMTPTGESIGDISDLIIDGDTAEVKAVVVGVGGFLGIGEKQIALPWADVMVNSDAQEITTDLTQEEAQAAPEYVFREQAEAPADDMGDGMADPAAAPMGDDPATMEADPTAEPMDPAAAPMETEPMDGDMPATDGTTAPAN